MTPGIDYLERPGAYGLVMRDGQILVIETAAGHFLPGGGTDDGELPDDALHRELLEETGLSVDRMVVLGTARQYVIDSSTGIGYNKIETFFRVTSVEWRTQPMERDHITRWMSIADALSSLREPAQAWAVQQSLR